MSKDLIEPGPFSAADEGLEEQEGGQSAQGEDTPPPAAEAPAAQPIFKGIQKEFTSLEELSKYTLELERQTLEQQAKLSGLSAVSQTQNIQDQPPVNYGLDYAKLGEEFILNPGGAVEKIVSHVRTSILGDVQAQTTHKEFYNAFYEANEDLLGCEDLVEASVARNRQAWANIPMDQAAKLLASDVRARAAKIRGGAAAPGATVLPSKSAHALPSGGNHAPKVPAAEPSKALSFSEQLKAQQAKHKKRA